MLTSKTSKRNLKENEIDGEELEEYAKATRGFRNRNKKTYSEALSDEMSLNGDDDNNTSSKSSKRAKNSEKAILNDSGTNSNNTNSRNTEMVHRLKVVENLLNDMMKSKDGWPFLKPVSRRDVNMIYTFHIGSH